MISFLTSLDDDWVKDPNDLRTTKTFVSITLASGILGSHIVNGHISLTIYSPAHYGS
jgi:hypothetical protein